MTIGTPLSTSSLSKPVSDLVCHELSGNDLILLGKKSHLIPFSILRRLGCLHCEWRDSSRCPVKKGHSYPSSHICDFRKFWILSLIPNYVTVPSVSQFQRDFNLALIQIRSLKEYRAIDECERNLSSFLSSLPTDMGQVNLTGSQQKRYNFLDGLLRSARFNWFSLVKKLVHYEDLQYGREIPKKIEHQHVRIKPSDVGRLIRDVNAECSVEPFPVKDKLKSLSSSPKSSNPPKALNFAKNLNLTKRPNPNKKFKGNNQGDS